MPLPTDPEDPFDALLKKPRQKIDMTRGNPLNWPASMQRAMPEAVKSAAGVQQQNDVLDRAMATHLASQAKAKEAERRRVAAEQKAAASQAKKDANTAREADFRTKGIQMFTDANGDIRPVTDENGAPRYYAKKGPVEYPNGDAVQSVRDEAGKTTIQDLDKNAKVGTAPNAMNRIFRQDKQSPWNDLGSVDEALQSGDPAIREAAQKAKDDAAKIQHEAAKKGFELSKNEIAYQQAEAMKAAASAEQRRQQLQTQIDAKRRIADQRSSIWGQSAESKQAQAEIDALTIEQNQLATAPDPKQFTERQKQIGVRADAFDYSVFKNGIEGATHEIAREEIAANRDPNAHPVIKSVQDARKKAGLDPIDFAAKDREQEQQLRNSPFFGPVMEKRDAITSEATKSKENIFNLRKAAESGDENAAAAHDKAVAEHNEKFGEGGSAWSDLQMQEDAANELARVDSEVKQEKAQKVLEQVAEVAQGRYVEQGGAMSGEVGAGVDFPAYPEKIAKLKADAEAAGIPAQKVDAMLDDTDTLRGISGSKKAFVLKASGTVAVDPVLAIDPKKWDAAINSTDASPEEKAKAKEARIAIRDGELGERIYNELLASSSFKNYVTNVANNSEGKSAGHLVEEYMTRSEGLEQKVEAIIAAAKGIGPNIAQQVFGIGAMVTGSDTLTGLMQDSTAEAKKLSAVRENMGGAGTAGFLLDTAGSIIPSLATGGIVNPVASRIGTTAARVVMGAAAGAQSAGGMYADAYDAGKQAGLSDEAARKASVLPAAASGLLTSILTTKFSSGLERMILSAGKDPAAKSAAGSALASYLKNAAKEAGLEMPEEGLDQLGQGIISKLSYDPGKNWKDIFSESFTAAIQGGLGAGFVSVASHHGERRAQWAKEIAQSGAYVAQAQKERERFSTPILEKLGAFSPASPEAQALGAADVSGLKSEVEAADAKIDEAQKAAEAAQGPEKKAAAFTALAEAHQERAKLLMKAIDNDRIELAAEQINNIGADQPTQEDIQAEIDALTQESIAAQNAPQARFEPSMTLQAQAQEQRAQKIAELQSQLPTAKTAEEVAQAKTIAAALVKVAKGTKIEALTAEEKKLILDKHPKDGLPRVEMVKGPDGTEHPVILDKAISRLSKIAPAAADLIGQDEKAIRADILAGKRDAKNTPTPQTATTPATPAPAPTGAAAVGNPASSNTPTTTPATGQRMRALTQPEISRVNAFRRMLNKQGIPDALADRVARGYVSANPNTVNELPSAHKDGLMAALEAAGGKTQSAEPDLVKRNETNKQATAALEASDVASLNAAKTDAEKDEYQKALAEMEKSGPLTQEQKVKLAKVVKIFTEALKRWNKAFSTITWTEDAHRSGGALSNGAGNLTISIADVLSEDGNGEQLTLDELIANPERANFIIREEAIHAWTQANISKERAIKLWDEIGQKARDMTADLYHGKGQWRKVAGGSMQEWDGAEWLEMNPYNMFHEFIRFVVEGKIGKNDIGGAEQRSPTLLRRIANILKAARDFFANVAKKLAAEGVDKDIITEIDETAKQCADAMQKIAGDAEASDPYLSQHVAKSQQTSNRGGIGGVDGGSATNTGGKGGNPAPKPNPTAGGGGQGKSSGTGASAGGDGKVEAELKAKLEKAEAELAERKAKDERAMRRRQSVDATAGRLADFEQLIASVPADKQEEAKALLASAVPGDPTYVVIVNQKRHPASYMALPPGVVQTSHLPNEGFRKNPNYGGENTRKYESDPVEQQKVRNIAAEGALDEGSIVTNVKSAADGPPQIAIVISADGKVAFQTAGGNGREMGMNMAGANDANRVADEWQAQAATYGFDNLPDGYRGYRFLGVFDLRQDAQAKAYQRLVDDLNPAPGVIAGSGQRAEIDARTKISPEALKNVSLDISTTDAVSKLTELMQDADKLGLDRNLMNSILADAPNAQLYVQKLLLASAFRSPVLSTFYFDSTSFSGSATVRGLIKAATAAAVELRAKGADSVADSIARTLETITDYIRNGSNLKVAIGKAAEQQEMGEGAKVVQSIATALQSKVVYREQMKNGAMPVDSDTTIEGFTSLFEDITRAVAAFDPTPDMFGESDTIEATLQRALTANARKEDALTPNAKAAFTDLRGTPITVEVISAPRSKAIYDKRLPRTPDGYRQVLAWRLQPGTVVSINGNIGTVKEVRDDGFYKKQYLHFVELEDGRVWKFIGRSYVGKVKGAAKPEQQQPSNEIDVTGDEDVAMAAEAPRSARPIAGSDASRQAFAKNIFGTDYANLFPGQKADVDRAVLERGAGPREHKRMRQLQTQQREEGLTQAEERELELLEKQAGQRFMEFFDEVRRAPAFSDVTSDGNEVTKVEQMALLSKRASKREASPEVANQISGDDEIARNGGEREFSTPSGLRVVRSGGASRRKYVRDLFPMYRSSYEKIGMQFAHGGQMLAEKTIFDVIYDAESKPLAFSVSKITNYGYKTVATGQNGSEAGKAAWKENLLRYSEEGYYSELSDKPRHIAEKVGIAAIPSDEAGIILGKKIEPSESNTDYIRQIVINGVTKSHVKRMFGVPVLWKSTQSSQNSNRQSQTQTQATRNEISTESKSGKLLTPLTHQTLLTQRSKSSQERQEEYAPRSESPRSKASTDASIDDASTNAAQKSLSALVARAESELTQEFKDARDNDAASGYPGLPGFFPNKGLTREERTIEAHFAQQVSQNPAKARNEYRKLAKLDFGFANYVNADLARNLYAAYAEDKELRASLEKATISPAGFVALNLAWNYNLGVADATEKPEAIFLAGGMASGKTTAANFAFEDEIGTSSVIYDAVMHNYDNAKRAIEQAASKGLRPRVVFVFRPFELAVAGAIKRLSDTGRPVNLAGFGPAHYNAQQVFLRLSKELSAEANFDVIFNETNDPKDMWRGSVDDLAARAYSNSDERSTKNTEEGAEEGTQRARDSRGNLPGRQGEVESGQAPAESLVSTALTGDENQRKAQLTAIYLRELNRALREGRITSAQYRAVFYGSAAADAATSDAPLAKRARRDDVNQLDIFGNNPVTNAAPNRKEQNNENTKPTKPRRNKPVIGDNYSDLFLDGLQTDPVQPGETPELDFGETPAGPRGTGNAPGRPAGSGALDAGGGAGGKGGGALGGTQQGGTGNDEGGVRGDLGQAGAGVTPAAIERPPEGSPDRNARIDGTKNYAPKQGKARFDANINAIRLMRTLEAEGRNPTEAEKEQLLAYTGWGWMKEAFNKVMAAKWKNVQLETRKRYDDARRRYDDSRRSYSRYTYNAPDPGTWEDYEAAAYRDYGWDENSRKLGSWAKNYLASYEAIRAELTDEEFDSAAKSVRNAHYTDVPIIAAMWKLVERLGFKGGRATEPGAGVGHFIGTQPDGTANRTRWNAVELDDVTARILGYLYPEITVNGDAPAKGRKVSGLGFQKARIPNNSQDLFISNVPFAKEGPAESLKQHGTQFNLHNYFFAQAFAKTKPGGLVVFITTAGTMDNRLDQRQALAAMGELVGAIRLPNDAFKANAGTEVTTDIIVFRKPDGTKPANFTPQEWTFTKKMGSAALTSTKPDGEGVLNWLAKIDQDWVPQNAEIAAALSDWRQARRPEGGIRVTRLLSLIEGTYEYYASKPADWVSPNPAVAEAFAAWVNDFNKRRDSYRTNRLLDAGGPISISFDAPIIANEYFANHPEHALGNHTLGGSMYGPDSYALEPRPGQNTIAELEKAIATFPENIAGSSATGADDTDTLSAAKGDRVGTYVERGDEIYEVGPDGLTKVDWKPSQMALFRQWNRLRNAYNTLIDAEVKNAPDDDIADARANLNRIYDSLRQQHHPLAQRLRNKFAFLDTDPDYLPLQCLEHVTQDTGADGKPLFHYEKAPIFRERQIQNAELPSVADTLQDAVLFSMTKNGFLHPPYVAELLGVSEGEAVAQLLENRLGFINPSTGILEVSDSYLSGNVGRKLEEAMEAAKDDPKYRANVEALQSVQPPWQSITSTHPNPRASWVPPEVIRSFAENVLMMTNVTVTHTAGTTSFSGRSSGNVDPKFEGGGMSAARIFEKIMDNARITVTRPDGIVGSKKTVVDSGATAAANAAAAEITQAFDEYVKTTDQKVTIDGNEISVTEATEAAFNKHVGGWVPPTFNGDWITLPGQSGEIYLDRGFRKSVLARLLTQGYGMIAHGVGSGKTLTQVALVMEMRRLKKAKKPVIVVEKSTIGQFAASFRRAYPQARLLVAGENNFGPKDRTKFLGMMQAGDWDAIIMTRPQVTKIPHDEGALQQYAAAKLAELDAALIASEEGSKAQGAIQAIRDNLMEKIQKMYDKLQENQDRGGIPWERLGVDAILVDEAHNFKNTFVFTNMENVKNLPSGDFAQQAISMELKTANVRNRSKGKGVFFATGTPVSNAMHEAWVMINYIAPHVLEQNGVSTFDQFADTYGQTVTAPEATWKGEVKDTTRFAKFIHGQALISMIRSVFDVAMGNASLGLDVPQIKGGKADTRILDVTPPMDAVNDWIVNTVAAQWTATFGEKDENGAVITAAMPGLREYIEDNPWVTAVPIMTMQAGIAAALDPRLLHDHAEDHHGSKVNTMVREILRRYNNEELSSKKTTQVVFSDLRNSFKLDRLEEFTGSNPFSELGSNPGKFDLYEDIANKLVAGGMRREEIGWIESGMSDDKKEAFFAKVNSGEIRVLIGGEGISTGVNIQERLGTAYHLMPPRNFKPAQMEQRNGRIIRQGNLFAEWAHNAFVASVEKASGQKFAGKSPSARRKAAMQWLNSGPTPTMFVGIPQMHKRDRIKAAALAAAAKYDIEIIEYGMARSLDSAVYAMMAAKQGFIAQILSGNVGSEFEDPTDGVQLQMAEMAAELIGDPALIRKIAIERELKTIRTAREAWVSKRAELSRTVRDLSATIPAYRSRIAREEELVAKYDGMFTKRTDADGKPIAPLYEMGDGTTFDAAAKKEKEDVRRAFDLQLVKPGDIYIHQVMALDEQDARKVGASLEKDGYKINQVIDLGKPDKDTPAGGVLTKLNQYFMSLWANRRGDAVSVAGTVKINGVPIRVEVEDILGGGEAGMPGSFSIGDGSNYSFRGPQSFLAKLRSTTQGLGESVQKSKEWLAHAERRVTPARKALEDYPAQFPKEADYNRLSEELAITRAEISAATQARNAARREASAPAPATTPAPDAPMSRSLIADAPAGSVQELVVKNIGLAYNIADSFDNIAGSEKEDRRSEARKALVKAARSYGPAKGQFPAFAGTVIRNALRDYNDKQGGYAKRNITTLDAPLGEEGEDTAKDMLAGTGDVESEAQSSEMRQSVRDAIAALPPKLAEVVEGIGRGDTYENIGARQGISKQGVGKKAIAALRLMRQHLQGRGVRSVNDLIRSKRVVADSPDDEIARLYRIAKSEEPGKRTIGRPDLSLGALDELVMAVDEWRKTNADKQSHKQWEDDAEKMLASDYAGTKARIIAAGLRGEQLSSAEVKAAMQIVVKEVQRAAADPDNAALQSEVQQLVSSYRDARAEQARGLAAGRDPLKSPADRHREFLAKIIYQPPQEVQKKLDEAKTPEEKRKILSEDAKRIARIQKALADMGITFDDIFSGEVELQLKNRKIVENELKAAKGKDADILKAFQDKRSFAVVAAELKVSEAEVKRVIAEAAKRIRDRHFGKFQKGATMSNVIKSASPIDAAEAEFAKFMDSLGLTEQAPQKNKGGRPKKPKGRPFDINDPVAVVRIARTIQSVDSGAFDMAMEWWMNNILSGPATHAANIAGNALSTAWDLTVQRGAEALVNMAFRRNGDAQIGEAKYLFRGLLPGIHRGLAMAQMAWTAEYDFTEHVMLGAPVDLQDISSKIVGRRAIPGAIGRIVRIPGRALMFADSFFKGVIAQMEVGAHAYRIAKAEGLKEDKLEARIKELVDQPGSVAWYSAVEKAKELTFQQDLKKWGETHNPAEAVARAMQDASGTVPPLRFIIPFIRTPFNIMRAGLRKTPLGSVPLAWDVLSYAAATGKNWIAKIRGGEVTANPELPADFVRGFAEQSIAWTILALIWGAVQGDDDDDKKQILITGSSPRTEATRGERELQKRAYGGDYVIRIGGRGGVTFNFSRYEPAATVLGTMTDAVRSMKRKTDPGDQMNALWGYTMAQVESKSFLRGISDMMAATRDSADVKSGIANTFAQAIIPNIIRQPLRNLDEYERDAKGGGFWHALIPSGANAEVKRDVFGSQVEKTGNGLSRMVVTPATKTEATLQPADRLLLRWNTQNPTEKYAPQTPSRTYRDPKTGKDVEMTPAQFADYTRRAGSLAKTMLAGKVTERQIQNPTEKDVEAIKQVFADARRTVREQMFGKKKTLAEMMWQ